MSYFDELVYFYFSQLVDGRSILKWTSNPFSERGKALRIARRLYKYVYLPGTEIRR